MTDRIAIRLADEGDRHFVMELASSLLEFGSPTWKDAQALAPRFRDVLAEAVGRRGSRAAVLIAEAPYKTPLGFISLEVREDVAGVERGHVADLAVKEDMRRMGVGRALMQAAEAWSRERGLPMLSLDVWSTNERALAFYRRLGYRAESFCLIKSIDQAAPPTHDVRSRPDR